MPVGSHPTADQSSARLSAPLACLQLQETVSDFALLQVWQEQRVELPACQVLMAFSESQADVKRVSIQQLRGLGFVLNSCIQNGEEQVERCTFFSLKFCSP